MFEHVPTRHDTPGRPTDGTGSPRASEGGARLWPTSSSAERIRRWTTGITEAPDGRTAVFLFFSNRLGCLGSLLVSAVLTLLVIGLLMLR